MHTTKKNKCHCCNNIFITHHKKSLIFILILIVYNIALARFMYSLALVLSVFVFKNVSKDILERPKITLRYALSGHSGRTGKNKNTSGESNYLCYINHNNL